MPNETPFPHLSSTGPAPTYIEVLTAYKQIFYERVAEGRIRPLVLPYHLYGCFFLLTYLYIPHTKSRVAYAARWPVLACITWFQWKTLWETSSESQAFAFIAGLTAAWGFILSVTWLLLYRPQWDAQRVQRRVARSKLEGGSAAQRLQSKGYAGEAGSRQHDPSSANGLRQRFHAGTTEVPKIDGQADGEIVPYVDEAETRDGVEYEYYWQSCPPTLIERVPWTMDLVMNMRGPGWNWAIPPLPALPPFVKAKLGEPVDESSQSGISPGGLRRFDSRRDLLIHHLPRFIGGYFLLDILKTTIMKDPYYVLGPNTYALPPHLTGLTPFQLKLFRQSLTSVTIVVALEVVFMLLPLGMCVLVGPSILGLRGEAWYYPSAWGPFSNVLNNGLNGLWGSWWHQTFRFAFAAPTNYLIDNGYIKPRTMQAKLCALSFAFGISGFLHAAGSVTQIALSHPWQAPAFFMSQALGILIQTRVCVSLHSQIRRLPKTVRQAGNFLFAWTWLWYTGWLLVDDFARGGLWLWEPLPISPTRALGLGSGDDSWWCWGDLGVGWYAGKHWWDSGIAV